MCSCILSYRCDLNSERRRCRTALPSPPQKKPNPALIHTFCFSAFQREGSTGKFKRNPFTDAKQEVGFHLPIPSCGQKQCQRKALKTAEYYSSWSNWRLSISGSCLFSKEHLGLRNSCSSWNQRWKSFFKSHWDSSSHCANIVTRVLCLDEP